MEKIVCVLCLLLIAVTVSLGQDGCPRSLPGQVGICVELCTNDGDCPRGQKCCSNGCGHECKAIDPMCDNNELPYMTSTGQLLNCGRGGQRCPDGYVCHIDPADRFAVCCPNKTVTGCLPVNCLRECRLKKDKRGCDICDCKDACQDKKCPDGYKCVLQKVECIRAPCPPIPQCVAIEPMCDNNELPYMTSTGQLLNCGRGGQRCPDGYVCHTDPADRFAVCCPKKTECRPVSCRSECRVKKDDKGCDICDCDDICPVPDCLPSCSNVRRGKDGGEECDCDTVCPMMACPPWCRSRRDERGCIVCDCNNPCPVVACLPGCRVVKDERGCDTCDCKDPCQSVRCEPGKICQVQPMSCFRPPCPDKAVCVDDPRCPPVRCSPECSPKRGPDGCNFCDCGDPCQECRPDQTCEVITPPCIWGRCLPPIGICKDPPAPPTDKRCTTKPRLTSCYSWIRYRYIYDVNYGTCRRLRWRTCSSSLNRFRTMRDCEEACKAPGPPITIEPPEPVARFPGEGSRIGRRQPIRSSFRIRG